MRRRFFCRETYSYRIMAQPGWEAITFRSGEGGICLLSNLFIYRTRGLSTELQNSLCQRLAKLTDMRGINALDEP